MNFVGWKGKNRTGADRDHEGAGRSWSFIGSDLVRSMVPEINRNRIHVRSWAQTATSTVVRLDDLTGPWPSLHINTSPPSPSSLLLLRP
ncbi:hypothetical protein AKJ16_DCAP25829 [Drosera capensis]